VQCEAQRARAPAFLRAVGQAAVPGVGVTAGPADRAGPDPVVELLHLWAGLIASQESDGSVAEVGSGAEAQGALVAAEAGSLSGGAVAEAAVDGGFGGA
jgi:hypothetical protein